MIRQIRLVYLVVIGALAVGLLFGVATASAATTKEITGEDPTLTEPRGGPGTESGTGSKGGDRSPRVFPNRETCMSYAKKAGQYLFLWLVGPLYDADANWATYRSAVDSYNGMDCDYYFGNIYHFMEKRRGAG